MNSSSCSSRRSSLIHQHYNSPSFSSSLLEEIYRSFDDEDDRENHHHYHTHPHPRPRSHREHDNSDNCRKLRMNKSSSTYMEEREIENDRLRGVNQFVLEQWMDNNNCNERINLRRNSMTAAMNSAAKFNSSSSTSSSDSSSGIGGFSSSDTESLYGSSKSKATPTLKPIRTNLNQPEFQRKCYSDEIPAKKKNSTNGKNKEGNLQKRALKLYGDLKKVKQPISPGGKLASFLNSLFNSNSSKKPKISPSSISSSSSNVMKYSTSTPSTASSYSRSCLSKTPSSAGRFERRSVRFCPVSTVIAATADNHKDYNEDKEDRWRVKTTTSKNEELKVQIMEKHRRVEEVAKELLKNYHHGRKFQNDVINKNKNCRFDDDENDEEEDDASCCSSDLFELDNLLEVGGDHRRYREELPVYETTHVHTNRAIANGFIL